MKTQTPPVTVHGRVTWLYHSSPAFSAGIMTTDDHRQLRFRGKFFVQAHECVAMTGTLVHHQVYGEQLDVESMTYDLAFDAIGLANYLANNPSFHGIGPAKATAIATAFGEDFDRVIREEPERIRHAVPLADETLTILREEWLARSEMNALASWLSSYGLTHCQLTKIVERFGHQAKSLLLADPYLLCREVEGFGFARTDMVAQKLGVAKDHPGRLAAALRDQLHQLMDDGHCWVARTALVRDTARVLALDDLDAEDRVAAGVETLITAGEVIEERDGALSRLALCWLYQRERDLAAWLRQYGTRQAARLVSKARAGALIDAHCCDLTARQREAINMALSSSICMIVGAAGSGKSYTIAGMYDIFASLEMTVALCAPTGKAARRLEEVSGARAQTLHRLLGYSGKSWQRGHENPLDCDVVIVDECSMVDVELAWRLFDAIDFSRTRLILVGDHQQLPPVGPGNPLRDVLSYDYVPVCVLDQVIRQAGTLKENSNAILTGQLAPTAPGVVGTARPWYVVDSFKDAELLLAALLELLREKLPAMGFDIVRGVQVITPYRKGPLGVQRINLELQCLMQRVVHGCELPPPPENGRPVFHPGDKVIQTRNNYGLDIMNGSIGVVIGPTVIADDHGTQRALAVDFDGRQVNIPLGSDAERDLELAYAITIHKSQGSEFPCVIAIVHSKHAYMLHRNLLYTAVTRARETAILFGDQTGMRRALDTVTVDARRSWLSVWGTPRVEKTRASVKEDIVHA
ncbi:MAG: SF1B family DNA helicase RecD2 [Armatimonadota bacterium]